MTLIEMLAQEGHGAVEVEEAAKGTPPRIITLIGPIRCWWTEWNSPRHQEYVKWRDALRVALVKKGYLVYSPHRAIQGRWHPNAQIINDAAILASDLVINLKPNGVPAEGTDKESRLVYSKYIPMLHAPPGNDKDLQDLVENQIPIILRARI